MLRYDEHTHEFSSRKILGAIKEGKTVALVTDAGTPGISDPGARLVAEAVKAGVKVTPIPGPSSVAAAYSAAADCSSRNAAAREARLASLADLIRAAIPEVPL
jgi:16S rRNA C1402 (ribose-2'-O) methylase RsmI